MQGQRFILTSTNERRTHEIVGSDEIIFEIVGKPFDLDQLIEIVARAMPQPL